jgi:hypothetical protein
MKNILLGAGANQHDASLASITTARSKDGRPYEPLGFPGALPDVLDTEPEMVCSVTVPNAPVDESGIEMYAYRTMGPISQLKRAPGSGTPGQADVQTAEYVQMIGGVAALVKASTAPGDNTQVATTYLVAQGFKYPLVAEEVKVALGYGNVAPVPVPTFMLALMPTGSLLDPQTAGGSEIGANPGG